VEAVLLKGPTCVGKTQLVVELAKRLPLRVISVDSASVYRGLDIGTAKPGPEERRVAPHCLVDLCSPDERYSAARFTEDAHREIARARELGQVPVLAGGTMLYFRALEQGLADLPGADAELRKAIQERAAREGWPALHEQLNQLDPAAAARIAPNDGARIERALEVLRLTGRPISELWLDASGAASPGYLKFALIPEDRGAWRRRIEERFDDMMKRGWLDEARALHALNLDPGLPATRTRSPTLTSWPEMPSRLRFVSDVIAMFQTWTDPFSSVPSSSNCTWGLRHDRSVIRPSASTTAVVS